MDQTVDLKNDVVHILESNVGRETALLYQNFYKDKDTSTVMKSFSELLLEFIGSIKQKEIVDSIKEKYSLSETV